MLLKLLKVQKFLYLKLRAYSIGDLKETLFELLGKTNEEIIGIREGEKLMKFS